MATNKSVLRKEIEAGLRDVNIRISNIEDNKLSISNDAYSIAKNILKEYRNRMIRIMEICVERNRF